MQRYCSARFASSELAVIRIGRRYLCNRHLSGDFKTNSVVASRLVLFLGLIRRSNTMPSDPVVGKAAKWLHCVIDETQSIGRMNVCILT